MLDLLYVFADWLAQFNITFPLPIIDQIVQTPVVDPITGAITFIEETFQVGDYTVALYNNSTIIIYLLWSILIIAFIALVVWLFKTLVYGILSVLY